MSGEKIKHRTKSREDEYMSLENRFKRNEWPGWELDKNLFGKEFDQKARERMLLGNAYMHNFVSDFSLGKFILECGPFFSPLMLKENPLHEQLLIYMDNGPNALKWLTEERTAENVSVIELDLNQIGSDSIRRNLGDDQQGASRY